MQRGYTVPVTESIANQRDLSIDDALEAALHAQVMRRCERAFVHELRDGLQAVSVSIDAMSRMAEKGPGAIEKLTPMAKRALQSHGQTIERVVHQMVWSDEPIAAVNVDALLRQLPVLLRNEAAKRDVSIVIDSPTLREDAREDLKAEIRAGKCFLALLSIALRILDSMSTGTLRVAASIHDSVVIDFFASPQCECGDWNRVPIFEAEAGVVPADWPLHVMRRLIANDKGSLEVSDELSNESGSATAQHVVRIRYPQSAV